MSPTLKRQAELFFKDLALGQIESHEILLATLEVIRELAESELQLLKALEVSGIGHS